MPSQRPQIPEPTKRAVRQRCGFGCVICGLPLYEYDHVEPWSSVRRHDVANLVLLCNRHHREKTAGLLPPNNIRRANANPCNIQLGTSSPLALHYSGRTCEANIGSNRHLWPDMHDGLITVPILVDDTPIVLFRVEDQHLLLTLQLFDRNNELIVQVIDNELIFSALHWDIEFGGRRLIVRNGPGDIFVDVRFDPPDRIVIDRGHMWRNGIELRIRPKSFVVGNTDLGGCSTVRCAVGYAVGDVPVSVMCGFGLASRRVANVPVAKTDNRVVRLS